MQVERHKALKRGLKPEEIVDSHFPVKHFQYFRIIERYKSIATGRLPLLSFFSASEIEFP